MLFGDDHAFFITAPKGWVLDNETGVPQGVHMAFYPAGHTWSNSPVIVYGRSVSKDRTIRSAEDQVARTLKDFHSHGSPKYKVAGKSSLALSNGKKAAIYFYEGDQWGNYEAAGYIEEQDTVNFLVFNAPKKAYFDKHIAAFNKLLSTYRSVGRPRVIDDKAFNNLIKEAKQQSSTPAGGAYESNIVQTAGKAVADFMGQCMSYSKAEEVGPFDMIARIDPDGSVSDAFVRPINTLSTCFRGLFINLRHRSHDFKTFLLHIDMRIKDSPDDKAAPDGPKRNSI